MMNNMKKVIIAIICTSSIILCTLLCLAAYKKNTESYIEFSFVTNQYDEKVLSSAPQKLISLKKIGAQSEITVRGKDSFHNFSKTKFSKNKDDLDKYLQKTDFIDFDNEEVIQLSENLNLSELEPIACAKTILKSINQNTGFIKYDNALAADISLGYTFGRSASETLKTTMGTCGEFANVFVALMRLNNIPCKYICGCCLDPSYSTLHAWAEFYDEKLGWIPVDPQAGILGVLPNYIKRLEGIDFPDTGSDFSKIKFGNVRIVEVKE